MSPASFSVVSMEKYLEENNKIFKTEIVDLKMNIGGNNNCTITQQCPYPIKFAPFFSTGEAKKIEHKKKVPSVVRDFFIRTFFL